MPTRTMFSLAVTLCSFCLALGGCDKKDSESLDIPIHTGTIMEQRVPLILSLPEAIEIGTPTEILQMSYLQRDEKKRPPFLVPKDVTNLAAGVVPSSSDPDSLLGDLKMITDGDKEATDGSVVELGPGLQHITLDIGHPQELFAVVFWHEHAGLQVYHDVVVQIADDRDFTDNVRTLFNNDRGNSAGLGAGEGFYFVSNNKGKLVDAGSNILRFVRLYSNGNTRDELNRYTEVEVYGRPVP